MLHKNRFRVGDGDGDGDGDYKGDDDGDDHGDGHDEEGDDANLNSSRSPPATQLAATRGNSRRHPSALVAAFSKMHGHCPSSNPVGKLCLFFKTTSLSLKSILHF